MRRVHEGELERAVARTREAAAAWERLAEGVDALRVWRESPCRRVSVCVDGRGRLVEVVFADRFRSAEPGHLGAAVVDAAARAQAGLGDRVGNLVHREVPGGGPATLDGVVEGYRARFPPPPDDRLAPPDDPGHRWLRR